MDKIPIVFTACGAVAGMGYGLAAVIRAWFDGRAKLLRARRGDPELISARPALPGNLNDQSRVGVESQAA